jgi:hypothetical protein
MKILRIGATSLGADEAVRQRRGLFHSHCFAQRVCGTAWTVLYCNFIMKSLAAVRHLFSKGSAARAGADAGIA